MNSNCNAPKESGSVLFAIYDTLESKGTRGANN